MATRISKTASDAEKYLVDRIKEKAPELAAAIQKDYRDELDIRTTILDISYDALIVNVYRGKNLSNKEVEIYKKIYNTLIEVVRQVSAGKTFSTLEDPNFLKLFNAKSSVGAILIDNGPNDVFLVGKNFDAIRRFVSEKISSNPLLKATRFGEKKLFTPILDKKDRFTGDYKITTRSKVDIGHIPAAESENLISPLESKLKAVLDYGIKIGSTRIAAKAKEALSRLYNIQMDINYNFRNVSPEAIARAQSVLGTGYVVVTLHTQDRNQKFSLVEADIYRKLVAELALSLKLETVKSSNTIITDIAANVANTLARKGKKLATHKAQTGTVSKKIETSVKSTGQALKVPDIRHFRSDEPKATNFNLLAILQAKINDQVVSNMGTGSDKRILNYRTGRLSESVEVRNLSESRQGMITAFYSYMKNPYATFSEGGKQEYPKTRDPKTLISKSIREIAMPYVGSRMRAVLV